MIEAIEKQKLVDWITDNLDKQENWIFMMNQTHGKLSAELTSFEKGYTNALMELYDEIINNRI